MAAFSTVGLLVDDEDTRTALAKAAVGLNAANAVLIATTSRESNTAGRILGVVTALGFVAGFGARAFGKV